MSNLAPDYPVGIHEAATHTGLSLKTLRNLAYKTGLEGLPPADYPSVNGQPAWRWDTWEKWMVATGRFETIQKRNARASAAVPIAGAR